MNKTPIKQSCHSTQLCVVCGEIAKRPRKVELTKIAINVRDLLLKYEGIDIESGSICRKCFENLLGLHKKSTSFYEQCFAPYVS